MNLGCEFCPNFHKNTLVFNEQYMNGLWCKNLKKIWYLGKKKVDKMMSTVI